MKLEGTVIQDAVGVGMFLLEADDGSRYALMSNDDELLQPGRRVSVEGSVATDAMGIGMSGAPVFEVVRFRRLD